MKYLIIDDDQIFADSLTRTIIRKGFVAEAVYDLTNAELAINDVKIDRIILDLKIGNDSGLSLLSKLKEQKHPADIILLTGYSSIRTAVEAIKLGAMEYLCKPVDIDDIFNAFQNKQEPRERVEDIPLERPSVKRLEWEHIQTSLMKNNGNVSATARELGMHRRTLQRKLQKRPVSR